MNADFTRADREAALQLRVPVGGREYSMRLALPTVGDVIPDVRPPGQRALEDLPYLVLDLLDTIDGEPPGLDEARRICRDPEALRALLTARNRLWSDLCMRGRLYALCPHCGQRESSFELSTLALALRAPPPPLFAPDGVFLEAPSLADRHNRGARSGRIPLTPRLRALLPSGRLDLAPRAVEAVLRDLDTDDEQGLELEAQAWDRWDPAGETPSIDHAPRRRDLPGARAILRLSVALRSLDGSVEVTPERVERLSIADFFFLEGCYYLTHSVDQPRPDALVVACAACGREYLPLR